jgi:N-acetylglucosaminyldiphosphoundecaprenol N-acetyl-beta-D-mannosaminyltransferase
MSTALAISAFPTCQLYGMTLARLDRFALLDHVFSSLAAGRGGWLITANLDFLRRHVLDAGARSLYQQADVCVADGAPLVWAARLQGDDVPERVAGSSLVLLMAERAAAEGRSLYLLGGDPGTSPRSREVMRERWPQLQIAGVSSPRVSSPPRPEEITALLEELVPLDPDVLLVGLGSPKQEELIRELRPHLPRTWMVGVGVTFSFIAGDLRRAPVWMQKAGLEWLHRMMQEPRRLARRYLIDDLPFAARLFGHALWRRARGR